MIVMKIFKTIILSSLGLLLIGAIVLAVFIATFDISHYKPRIIQELSSALSREVHIDQLRLDFKFDKGLTIAVKGLSIADEPAFSRDKILTVDSIYLNTDILALIFHRQIAIARIEISGPRVHLVRNKDGLLNVQTLFGRNTGDNGIRESPRENSIPAVVPTTTAAHTNETKDTIVIPPMLIRAVRIENGALTFVDESLEPSLTVPLQQIDFQATQLSLEKPFPFEVKARLWADQQNIMVDGEIALDIKNNRVNLQKVKLETDLSLLRLRTMPFYGVLKEQLLLEGDIDGKLVLPDIALRADHNGLAAFSVNGELTGGRISSELLKKPLEDIHGRFHVDESNIAINELAAAYASGTISGQGRWSDYGRSNMLMFDLKVDGVQLGELIPRASMPVLSDTGKPLGVEGGISAVFDAEGHGAQIPELREALQGDGSVEIRGGKLLNINLLRFVLEKLSFIPDIVQKVETNLPQRYKNGLKSPVGSLWPEAPSPQGASGQREEEETVLERVVLTAKFKDQALFFDAEVQADGFAITASGNLDLDQTIALAADFLIREDLAASMIASVPELSYLSDTSGRIHIPFKPYQGKFQNIGLYPDVEELARKVLQNRGKEELKRAIFRALDIEETPANPSQREPAGQQTPGEAPPQGEETPQKETKPEKILIDGIFDAIFKGKETP